MSKKVVIIGGGIAGLSAGIYAAMNDFDTEIIEMSAVAGGQCTAWDRKGYRFDYCLHWLVGTSKGAFHQIWKETNVLNDETEVIDHEIHSRYRIISEMNLSFTPVLTGGKNTCLNLHPKTKYPFRKCVMICVKVLCWNLLHWHPNCAVRWII